MIETNEIHLLAYYAEQGKITDPCEFVDDLPASMDLSVCCDSINNILLIDFLVNMGLVDAPEKNKADVGIKNVEEKLRMLFSRNNALLEKARSTAEKILGNCRDTSVLLCSMLRKNNISARVRSGFATFFDPTKRFDHWLCEYWSKEASRWIKVDSWMYQIRYLRDVLPPPLKEGLVSLSYNPLDVEDIYFISGGQAWLRCQSHGEAPDTYGTYGDMQGLWFIRDNMLRDLLCLNKTEILPWDCKGLMSGDRGEVSEQDKEALSIVANILEKPDLNFTKIREYYLSNEGLHF